MQRLDWRLVYPIRPGQRDRVEEIGAELTALEAGRPGGMTPEGPRYDELAQELGDLTVPPCEATGAPKVGDAPGWEQRVLLEFHEGDDLDEPVDFDEYAALRHGDYDCSRCPYRTPYSADHLDPCEMDASPLLAIVTDGDIADMALADLEPPEMQALADRLDGLAHERTFDRAAAGDPADFLRKASLFLRFWAELGFSIAASVGDAEDDGLLESGEAPEPEPTDPPSRTKS